MKKLIAAMAALAMLAAISTTALAASVPVSFATGTPGTATAPVQTTTMQTDVYSATIDWGAMTFAYDFGTWNATTHTWGGAGWASAGFTGANDAVTVTNDSSQAITANFTYIATAAGTNNTVATIGTFTPASGNLYGTETGTMALALYPVGTPDPNDTGTTYLNIKGPPAASSIVTTGPTAEHAIGNITVTLNTVS